MYGNDYDSRLPLSYARISGVYEWCKPSSGFPAYLGITDEALGKTTDSIYHCPSEPVASGWAKKDTSIAADFYIRGSYAENTNLCYTDNEAVGYYWFPSTKKISNPSKVLLFCDAKDWRIWSCDRNTDYAAYRHKTLNINYVDGSSAEYKKILPGSASDELWGEYHSSW
jgi:hypothetical protein